MQDLKISIVQTNLSWEDPYKNLQSFQHKLNQLTDKQDVIILPEMFNTGFTMNVEKCAEKENGQTVNWLKEQALKKNCVVCGSILINEDKKFYNRMFWMRPDGTIDTYDKRHLFRMGNEHQTMSQGSKKKVVVLKEWKINLLVCYDLRFPVWSKNKYSNNSYEFDVLLYIANWPEVRSYAYKSLLIARAIENQAYVIWVNRIGKDGNGIIYSGDSMVVDHNGKIKVQAKRNKEELLETTISYLELDEDRIQFKVGLDWDNYNILI